MSNINRISKQPKCGYIKASRGLCKITLRNTTHVSDKAYRKVLSDSAIIGNLRHNPNIRGNRKKIDRVLQKWKKDQMFIFSNDQNLYEIKEK